MSERVAPSPPSFVRPVLALLAGLGVIVLIVGVGTIIATLGALRGVDPKLFQPTPVYRSIVLVLTVVGAFAGGFTAARVTSGRSFYTVSLLALMLLVSGVVPVLRNGHASGMVSNAVAAIVSMAAIQPAAPMMNCISGANTN